MMGRDDYGLDCEVVVQSKPNGLAAAYSLAIPFLDGSPSLLYLGDCLLTGGASHLVDQHLSSGADVTVMVHEVDDPGRYGIVEVDDRGRVTSLVEKPADPRSNLAIVGVYAFQPTIADAVESIAPSARGEYEITDAIQHLVDRGGTVRWSALEGWWIDTGTVADVLAANSRLLAESSGFLSGSAIGAEAAGAIVAAEGAEFTGSRFTGPVTVSEGAVVRDSEVGPFCHIGRGATLEDVHLRNSIVMDGAVVRSLRVRDSIIGPRSFLEGHGGQDEVEVVVGSDATLVVSASHEG